VQGVEDPPSTFRFLDRQIWPGDVADEQCVAGEQRPRLITVAGVDQRKGCVLRTVPRRMQGAHLLARMRSSWTW
jgi:hypothetical protein